MTMAALIAALAAATPSTGRFDLVCTGSRVEALGETRAAPEPWSGRLAIDLGRGVAHRDDEQENLRLLPGPADRLVIQDEVKGFGDAVVRLEAHVDRASGAYHALASTEVGAAFRQETATTAACRVAPFSRLAPKDAPEPIPEAAPPAPPGPVPGE